MEALPNLVFLALLIGVFYFLLIRPQKKRVDQHRRLIESVNVGDEIITIGGLLGTVRAIDDENIQLEIAPETTVRFTKAAIARRVTEDSAEEASDEAVGTTGE